jgi:peptidoglycan/LPS O-acetylase OafA/YrhL
MIHKNCFDALRFFAATLVLFSHCFPLLGIRGREPLAQWSGYTTGGELGVVMFFAISGYLVTASLLASDGLLNFFAKRALRIFPALIVVVLLTIFVLGPLMTTLPLRDYFHHQWAREYLFNILLWVHFPLPGVFENLPLAESVNGSLWTLPIEVGMYVLLAVLGTVTVIRRHLNVFVPILFFAGYAQLVSDPALKTIFFWKIETVIACAKFGVYFFSGALLYQIRNSIPWRGGIALALLVLWFFTFKTKFGICSMFLAVPYCTIYLGRSMNDFFSNFGKYGDFSYGIYIYAFPTQQTLVEILGKDINPYLFFLIAFSITICFAFLSWHLIESPALRFKERFALARTGKIER